MDSPLPGTTLSFRLEFSRRIQFSRLDPSQSQVTDRTSDLDLFVIYAD
ncbi:MAG: hypothetical protein ACYCYP_04185 [Leptospirales bacterium]